MYGVVSFLCVAPTRTPVCVTGSRALSGVLAGAPEALSFFCIKTGENPNRGA